MNRTISRRDFLQAGAAVTLGITVAPLAHADAYPSHPIRLFLTLAAGSSIDTLARAFTTEMGNLLSQPIIVENRPGADGVIATRLVQAAAPDGYTLLMVTPSHATNVYQYPSLNYDPVTSFTPIALVASNTNFLVVNERSPIKSFSEFLANAKAHPGAMNYGSVGGSMQGSADLFNYMAKVQTTSVSYRGAPAAVTDLLGGSIDFIFLSKSSALPLIRSGKLRPLAVTDTKRDPALPDVPAVAEFIPGYSTAGWYALLGPKNLPPTIARTLNEALFKSLQLPEVQARLASIGSEPAQPNGPEQLTAFLRSEIVKWKTVTQSKE